QSTINPNMPLRDLFYLACVYSCLTREENLFGETLIRIPEPRFVTFYNGVRKVPEREIQRLSDAYINPSDDPDLELKVTVLNINEGFNEELMEKCQTLQDYMVLVSRIRHYNQEMPLASAVETAVNECIRDDILADFLKKNRSEVIRVGIFEYDEEKHMQQVRAEGREEGRQEGREEGLAQGADLKLIALIQCKLSKHQSVEQIAEALEESPEYIQELIQKIDIC
ncbi:MAG: hypothetical protein LUC32_07380, partial [Clostridiales bacterium]|nr:hypothetical protein [Clostridiales bacterium]